MRHPAARGCDLLMKAAPYVETSLLVTNVSLEVAGEKHLGRGHGKFVIRTLKAKQLFHRV